MAGNVPVGVKVIAVLYYISAVLSVIMGILLMVGSAALTPYIDSLGGLAGILGGALIVLGIIIIAFGVLAFFIGRGLWKAKKWARIVAIIIAALGVLSGIISLIQGDFGSILGLVINAIIGGYLLFSKGVKAAFA